MYTGDTPDPTTEKEYKVNDNSKLKEDIKQEEKELLQNINTQERDLLQTIGSLYSTLNKSKMDFNGIGDAIDALARFNEKGDYTFLNNLLCPERCKGVKIPSSIPIPSCSFQLHNTVTLSTNALGVCALMFNPFFLADDSMGNVAQKSTGGDLYTVNNPTTLWINNSVSIDGSSSNAYWVPKYIGQSLPGVYDQYRLVSASLVVRYIGRLDIASGLIGGGILFEQNPYIGGELQGPPDGGMAPPAEDANNPAIAKYANFDFITDSFYHQENNILEGIRELYFPLDNSYEEYVRTLDGTHCTYDSTNNRISAAEEYYKSGFNFFVYTLNAPPSSACLKVDIYCNFECLPNAQFLNYMPLSISVDCITNEEKKKAILQIQNQPITTIKGARMMTTGWKPYFKQMAQKFGGKLSGIAKLMAKGLIFAAPAFKPAISLVGNMMSMDNDL